jgi:hypothetical protein
MSIAAKAASMEKMMTLTMLPPFVVIPAAEEEREPGPAPQHGDGAGKRGGDRRDKDIAVLDMGELVREHAFQFLLVEYPQDARCHRDNAVLGVSPCGKGVRTVIFNYIDARHGNRGALRSEATTP